MDLPALGIGREKENRMPNLATDFIHLGRGATAEIEPPFDGEEWFEDYTQRREADGPEGRLVLQYTFSGNWSSWEVHPHGAEVVVCTAGTATIIQEFPDGRVERIALMPGDYAINPPGVWHTADSDPDGQTTCIFITAGAGTAHRPR
jgi:quercetin dioxygenase-like cupin family protein